MIDLPLKLLLSRHGLLFLDQLGSGMDLWIATEGNFPGIAEGECWPLLNLAAVTPANLPEAMAALIEAAGLPKVGAQRIYQRRRAEVWSYQANSLGVQVEVHWFVHNYPESDLISPTEAAALEESHE